MATTLYAAKPAFQRKLEPLVEVFVDRGISADAVTWFGLGVSALVGAIVAAAGTAPRLLLAVPVLLLVRMAANAVDGQLARRTRTTQRGAVLNEVCDVAGDALAYLPFAPLMSGGFAWLVVGIVVTGLVAEVAAIATANAASTSVRRNAGPMGKSDRALAFSILALLIAIGASPTFVTAALSLVLVLGLATIRNRMLQIEVA